MLTFLCSPGQRAAFAAKPRARIAVKSYIACKNYGGSAPSKVSVDRGSKSSRNVRDRGALFCTKQMVVVLGCQRSVFACILHKYLSDPCACAACTCKIRSKTSQFGIVSMHRGIAVHQGSVPRHVSMKVLQKAKPSFIKRNSKSAFTHCISQLQRVHTNWHP